MTSLDFTDSHLFDTREMGFWEYSAPILWRAFALAALIVAATAIDYRIAPASPVGCGNGPGGCHNWVFLNAGANQ